MKQLGKLTLGQDYDVEEEAARRIITIPNYENYFLPIDFETKCKPKAIQEQKDTDIWKCDYLRKAGYDMGDSIFFKIKYGGVDSTRYVCNPRKSSECVKNAGEFVNWSLFLEHLLEAGATLTLYQLVHYDIHRHNILISEKTKKPILIDFGQAFYADQITDETLGERWKLISPNQRMSEYEPPEITLATYIRKGFSPVEAYSQVVRYKDPMPKAEAMLGLSRQVQGREFAEFWRDSGAVKKGDWVQMFKFYWPTFDAWNIGGVLLHLLEYCYIQKDVANSPEFRQAEGRFKEVLRGLLQMSPKKRLDCVEALNLWNSENPLLQTERAQAWLETRAKQRA